MLLIFILFVFAFSKVVEYPDFNIKEVQNAAIKFYTPWCGHCKKIAPLWEAVGEEFEDNDFQILAVNCQEHSAACYGSGINSYPTLKLLKNGRYAKDFDGLRTKENILQWIENEMKE